MIVTTIIAKKGQRNNYCKKMTASTIILETAASTLLL